MCCIYVDFSYPEVKFFPPGFSGKKMSAWLMALSLGQKKLVVVQ